MTGKTSAGCGGLPYKVCQNSPPLAVFLTIPIFFGSLECNWLELADAGQGN